MDLGDAGRPDATDVPGVLCYIDGCWAFFTTRELSQQWGDDWNDVPYEHNAGDPYEARPELGDDWTITRVAFLTELEPPCEQHGWRSPWSVEQINARQVAWLVDPMYGHRPEEERHAPVVWAGATFEQFRNAIVSRGGKVFVQDSRPLGAAFSRRPAGDLGREST